jgi:hypothetical protein
VKYDRISLTPIERRETPDAAAGCRYDTQIQERIVWKDAFMTLVS